MLVSGVDRERGRISIYQAARKGSLAQRDHELPVGTDIDATVTRVMPYGAFVRIEDGVEGLIHVSELASRRVSDPNEVVHVGDRLPVKVVSIDRERRRLSLSSRLAETQ